MANDYSTRSGDSSSLKSQLFCEEHQLTPTFVCNLLACSCLLCPDCLPAHRDHPWESLTQFRKQIHKLEAVNSKSPVQLAQRTRKMSGRVSAFSRRVEGLMERVEEQLRRRVEAMGEVEEVPKQVAAQIGWRKRQEGKGETVWEGLEEFVEAAVTVCEEKVLNCLKDLQLALEADWIKRSPAKNKEALHHLQLSLQPPQTHSSFSFDPQLSHPGIQTTPTLAKFIKSVPTRPVAITSSPISASLHKWKFQITHLSHTAFFFADSTIFVGVCLPAVVRQAGMRRITEPNKGGFLIGSTGWAYHHSDAKFDRKNIVGWTFTQGDTLIVEVSLQRGQLTVGKPGFIFDSSFSMPLGLTREEMLTLRPCCCFDGEEGAAVRILPI